MKIKLLIFLSVLVLLVGCAAGNQPSKSDKTQAQEPTTSQGASSGVEHNITMELSKFAFDPNIIEVNQGDVIHFTLTSKDTTHGFSIDAYNVNMTVVQPILGYWHLQDETALMEAVEYSAGIRRG